MRKLNIQKLIDKYVGKHSDIDDSQVMLVVEDAIKEVVPQILAYAASKGTTCPSLWGTAGNIVPESITSLQSEILQQLL